MPGRERRHGALAQHGLDAQLAVVVDRRTHQADVGDAGADRAQLIHGGAFAELDLDPGPRGSKALHRSGHDREQGRANEVDAQPPGLAGVDPPRGRHGALELRKQRPCVAQERGAGRGQLNPPAGSHQQGKPELILQRADLLAQRRL